MIDPLSGVLHFIHCFQLISGGVAFVLDGDERFQNHGNTDTVDLESAWMPHDCALLRHLVEYHLPYTGSRRATALRES